MKAAAIHKQSKETGSGSPAKPFFAKSAENSFFSSNQSSQSFFPAVQTKLTLGQPGDKFEQEADATADQVMRMPTANTSSKEEEREETVQTKLRVQRQTEEEQIHRQRQEEEQIQAKLLQKQSEEEEEIQPKLIVQRQPEEEEEMLQAKGAPPGGVSSSFEGQLTSNKGSGERLDSPTQQFMESRFNADFSGVRVHTDQQATQMSQQINAQAFAHGSDIYFNQGKYNPGTGEGKQLLAHELTHTIQQGASVQQKPVVAHTHHPVNVQADFNFPDIDLPDIDLPDLSIDAFRDKLGDYADDYLPAYSLLSVIISYDLIRGQSVARNRDNIIKGIFSLINPFGSLLRQRLEERGIIDDAFVWINTQLSELGLTRANVEQKFDEFWEEKEIVRTDFLSYNLGLLERKFGPFLTSIGQFISRATDQVFTMIKNAFLQLLADLARQLGGYDLLADLLGQDPITGEERNATTADILRGILRLPVIQAIGGDKLLIKLESENLIEKAAAWIDAQWALLQASFTNIYNIGTRFVEGFSFETLQDPMGFINGLKEDVVGFVTNITRFFKNLASKALELIKEALIALLKRFINENTYGFDLVKVVLGKDPITGEPYPRTAENIITAFLKLLPNGEALAAHMKETGAIPRAMDWVMGAIQEFIQIITAVKLAFINLWARASIDNLFEPIPFFTEILNLFTEPVQRLVTFVRRVLFKLLEILFQIMKLPIDLAQQIIANIQRAYQDIRKDPIAFLLNLLGSVKLGFQQFFDNFLPHLLGGLQTWLFGQLAEAGIQPPPDLSFRSILGLVFDIFGITVNNIMDRLAQKIGPERVARIRAMMDRLTGIWTFVKDVIEQGPVAIWERIREQLSNLWDMVVEGVKNWIMTNIIEKVTAKLLSMLDPTGVMAVINGFVAFYRAVQSFIEQLRAMLEIANSFVAGVVDIARGSLQTAANFLENALSQALPVAIGFLANQVGLRGLGERISEIIGGIRERVNQGIDWLIDRAMSAGSAVLRMLGLGREEETETHAEVPSTDESANDELVAQYGPEKAAQISAGLRDIDEEEIKHIEAGKITQEEAELIVSTVRKEHQVFTSLRVVDGGESWDYEWAASPATTKKGKPKADPNLKEAVKSAENVIDFIRQLANGATVGGIDRYEYDRLMSKQENVDWIKARFRSIDSGMHELIPTNLISEVLDRIAGLDSSIEAADWFGLQNALRIDTSWVIFKLELGEIKDGYIVLQGHVGAMYLNGSRQTKWTNVFHDHSRDAFSLNRGRDQMLNDLIEVFEQWVWDGSGNPGREIHPGLTWKGKNVAENFTSIAAEQARNYRQTMRMIEHARNHYY